MKYFFDIKVSEMISPNVNEVYFHGNNKKKYSSKKNCCP